MARRALVTGGTRGIGKEIAKSLRDAGYKVAVVYVGNGGVAEKFEAEEHIKTFQCDVSDYQQCVKVVPEIATHLGGSIEILINNAGITRDGMFHKMPLENWQAVIDTNLGSVFNMSRCVIEGMRATKFGRIISLSSVNANGAMGQANYSASKAGIEGFTKTLALENANQGITVNAIAPGYINTEMMATIPPEVLAKIIARIPMGRLGEVREIADAVLYLASEEATFTTGMVLSVNGGLRT